MRNICVNFDSEFDARAFDFDYSKSKSGWMSSFEDYANGIANTYANRTSMEIIAIGYTWDKSDEILHAGIRAALGTNDDWWMWLGKTDGVDSITFSTQSDVDLSTRDSITYLLAPKTGCAIFDIDDVIQAAKDEFTTYEVAEGSI